MKVKVILLTDDKKLGKKNTITEVAYSYAKNVLIPKGIAVQATKENLNRRDALVAKQERIYKENVAQAEELKNKLEEVKTVEIVAEHSSNGRMFGSITNKDVSDTLKSKYNIEIKKQDISLSIPIKATGVYPVTIKLFGGSAAEINVAVL